jgi:hypothetical protein
VHHTPTDCPSLFKQVCLKNCHRPWSVCHPRVEQPSLECYMSRTGCPATVSAGTAQLLNSCGCGQGIPLHCARRQSDRPGDPLAVGQHLHEPTASDAAQPCPSQHNMQRHSCRSPACCGCRALWLAHSCSPVPELHQPLLGCHDEPAASLVSWLNQRVHLCYVDNGPPAQQRTRSSRIVGKQTQCFAHGCSPMCTGS